MGSQVYSKSLWAQDFDPQRSLLERLFAHYMRHNKTSSKTPYVVLLIENYRCHAKILEFPSDCFYGGKLVARGDQSTHELVPVLSFYAAQGMDNLDEASLAYYNDAEVAEVVKRVDELIQLWPRDWSKNIIGVLTPYHDQVFTYTNCTDCLITHSTTVAVKLRRKNLSCRSGSQKCSISRSAGNVSSAAN